MSQTSRAAKRLHQASSRITMEALRTTGSCATTQQLRRVKKPGQEAIWASRSSRDAS